MSSVTANSRMIYAFSRDGALPGVARSGTASTRAPARRPTRSGSPPAAPSCSACPYLWNATAYAAVTSIAVIGLYIAYVLPTFLRLRQGDAFERGPWHLGRWSRPIGIIAVGLGRVHHRAVHAAAGQPGHRTTLQLHAGRGARGARLRRHLVAGLGAARGSPARRSRARPRSSPRSSATSARVPAPAMTSARHPVPAERSRAASPSSGLRVEVEAGSIDTVAAGHAPTCRAACRASGWPRELLPRRGAWPALRRGLQLPAGRRRRHEHGRRLRDVVLGAGLRRLRAAPGPGHAAAGAVAPGHRAGPLRRRAGRTARRWRPRPGRCCAGSSTGWPSAAGARTSAPSWSSSSSATPTRRPGARATADLTPANQYNVDYSILGTARIEPLLRRIRNGMAGAGMFVESAKGECNLGQHEIAFRYAEALATCDNHVIYKTGAKEIAAQEGMSAHLHGQVRRARGQLLPHPPVAARRGRRRRCWPATADHGLSPLMEHFLAGQLAGAARADPAPRAERQLLQALRRRQLRADRGRLGLRQPHLRAAGGRRTAPSLRVENRVPGGDVNPYLAVAAMIAAGPARHRPGAAARAGLRRQRLRRPDRPRVPTTLRDAPPSCGGERGRRSAPSATTSSSTTRNDARVELAAFDAAVTDWERRRGFERL